MLRLAYTSLAARPFTDLELDALLDSARRHNRPDLITGFLTYDGAAFFQFLEGPHSTVERLLERLRADHRHHDLRVLFQVTMPPGAARALPDWSMHYRPLASLTPHIQDRLARLMSVGSMDERGEDTTACLEMILRMRFPGSA